MPLWHFWHPGTWVVPVNSIKNLFPLEKSLFFYTQFKSFKYFYILAIATFRIYNRNNRIIELEFRAKPVKYKPVSCWVSLGKDFKNVTCGYRRTGACSSPRTQESTVGTRNTRGTAYSVKTKYSGSVVVGISVKLHHQKLKFEPKVFQSYEKMNSQSACLCSTTGPVWPWWEDIFQTKFLIVGFHTSPAVLMSLDGAWYYAIMLSGSLSSISGRSHSCCHFW